MAGSGYGQVAFATLCLLLVFTAISNSICHLLDEDELLPDLSDWPSDDNEEPTEVIGDATDRDKPEMRMVDRQIQTDDALALQNPTITPMVKHAYKNAGTQVENGSTDDGGSKSDSDTSVHNEDGLCTSEVCSYAVDSLEARLEAEKGKNWKLECELERGDFRPAKEDEPLTAKLKVLALTGQLLKANKKIEELQAKVNSLEEAAADHRKPATTVISKLQRTPVKATKRKDASSKQPYKNAEIQTDLPRMTKGELRALEIGYLVTDKLQRSPNFLQVLDTQKDTLRKRMPAKKSWRFKAAKQAKEITVAVPTPAKIELSILSEDATTTMPIPADTEPPVVPQDSTATATMPAEKELPGGSEATKEVEMIPKSDYHDWVRDPDVTVQQEVRLGCTTAPGSEPTVETLGPSSSISKASNDIHIVDIDASAPVAAAGEETGVSPSDVEPHLEFCNKCAIGWLEDGLCVVCCPEQWCDRHMVHWRNYCGACELDYLFNNNGVVNHPDQAEAGSFPSQTSNEEDSSLMNQMDQAYDHAPSVQTAHPGVNRLMNQSNQACKDTFSDQTVYNDECSSMDQVDQPQADAFASTTPSFRGHNTQNPLRQPQATNEDVMGRSKNAKDRVIVLADGTWTIPYDPLLDGPRNAAPVIDNSMPAVGQTGLNQQTIPNPSLNNAAPLDPMNMDDDNDYPDLDQNGDEMDAEESTYPDPNQMSLPPQPNPSNVIDDDNMDLESNPACDGMNAEEKTTDDAAYATNMSELDVMPMKQQTSSNTDPNLMVSSDLTLTGNDSDARDTAQVSDEMDVSASPVTAGSGTQSAISPPVPTARAILTSSKSLLPLVLSASLPHAEAPTTQLPLPIFNLADIKLPSALPTAAGLMGDISKPARHIKPRKSKGPQFTFTPGRQLVVPVDRTPTQSSNEVLERVLARTELPVETPAKDPWGGEAFAPKHSAPRKIKALKKRYSQPACSETEASPEAPLTEEEKLDLKSLEPDDEESEEE